MTKIYDGRTEALQVEKVGRTLVIHDAKDKTTNVSKVEGHTIMFIGPQSDTLRRRFAAWLQRQSVTDAAKTLSVSVGNVAGIRSALGIRRE